MAEETSIAAGLMRATGAVLGLHVRIAQKEATNDIGRLLTAVLLLGLALAALGLALVGAHVAAVFVIATFTPLDWLRAVGLVACVDLLLAILLGTMGRSMLRRPILRETRSLLRETLTSFSGAK